MTKIAIRTIAAFLCLVMAAGCWNRRELNDLAVSVAIGVDKRGGEVLISDQVLNTGAISGKGGGSVSFAPVTLFLEKGGGFQEAARRMTTQSTRKIYVGQMQMLVFGEKFAREEGLNKVLDHISRDHEYRLDFYVVIARGTEAQNILKVLTPVEKTPATKMFASLKVSEQVWGTTTAVRVDDLISTIISGGKEPALTGIRSLDGNIGNDKANISKILPPSRLIYSGVAVFKKDKLLGWLNEEESLGYNFTQGNVKSTSLLLPCPSKGGKHMTVELLRTRKKTKADMMNGKPVMDVKVRTDAVITDSQCTMDFSEPSSITEVNRLVRNRIESSVTAAVKTAQQRYKSDIFGFGEVIARKYPKYWKRVKSDWNDVFAAVKVNVKSEANIRIVFKTQKSLMERMKGS